MKKRFEIHDEAFNHLVLPGTEIEQLATGFGFTEGPIWFGDHLLFSDIPNSRIVRYQRREDGPHVTTYRHPSGNANGNTRDKQGRLVTCEQPTWKFLCPLSPKNVVCDIQNLVD